MIDFERFWAGVPDGFGEDPDEYEAEDARPGVDHDAIRDWEQKHGVKLPKLLRTALEIQNGGFVRNTPMEISPLEEIVPVGEEFWEFTEIEDEEAPNHDLMFVVGQETEVGGTYLLNFNANGPKGEPSVYLDFHGESTYRVGGSLEKLLKKMLSTSPVPSVNWSEIEDLPALARESIDISPAHEGKPASVDQVLTRQGEALVLFTRERSPEGETLSRTLLPLPLDIGWAEIRSYRPAPIGTYALHLQPEESDGIVNEESRCKADGKWKNTTEHGVPIYVMFESTNREELVALRRQLLGDDAAARAQAKQDCQAELGAVMDSLSPAERIAAMLQSTAVKMQGIERGAESDMPPELAQVSEMMRRKMDEMIQRAQQQIEASPQSLEAQQKIADILRRMEEQ